MRRELVVAFALFAAVPVVGAAGAEGSATSQAISGSAARLPDPLAGAAELIAPTDAALAGASITGKQNGTEFKGTFVPARALDVKYVPVLSETKVSVSNDTTTSLTRLAVGVAYNPYALRSSRVQRILEDTPWCHTREMSIRRDDLDKLDKRVAAAQKAHEAAVKEGAHPGQVAALAADLEAAQKERDAMAAWVKKDDESLQACTNEAFARQWSKINGTWVPQVSLTGAMDLYPGGDVPSATDPTKTDELEAWGGWRTDLAVTVRPWERGNLDVWGTLRRTRASGKPGTKLVYSHGGGATVSWLWWSFLGKEDRPKSTDYVREGFLPGLAAGVSGQYLRCDGREQCANLRTDSRSVTPFIDVRVKPALQFRLAFPITWFDSVDKNGAEVAPTFTVAGSIAGL